MQQQIQYQSEGVAINSVTIQQRIQRFPFYNKLLITISTVLFIIDLFDANLYGMFCMNPEAVLLNYEGWRFMTSPFYNQNLPSLMMSILISITDYSVLESIIGTSTIFLTLIKQSALFNQLYLILIFLIDYIFGISDLKSTWTGGLWPFLAVDLVSRTLTIPNGERQIFQFSSLKLRNWVYLLIILVVSIVAHLTLYQWIVIFFLGAIEAKCFNGMIFRFKRLTVQNFQKSIMCRCFLNRRDFTLSSNCSDSIFEKEIPVNNLKLQMVIKEDEKADDQKTQARDSRIEVASTDKYIPQNNQEQSTKNET